MNSRRTGYALAVAGMIAALPAAAQQNNALLCTGHGDYLAAESFVDVSNNFTIDLWINPTEQDEIDTEAIHSFAGVQGQHFVLYPVQGTDCWGPGHAGVGISAGTNGVSVFEHAAYHMPALLVYEGKIEGWTHIAVVYRDKTPSLYINGMYVKTGLRSSYDQIHPTAGIKPRPALEGGIGGGKYGYFTGMLDDVHIWNRPLAEGEISATMTRGVLPGTEGLVLNFDMNRIGSGKGLLVTNVAGTTATPGAMRAVTFGTATTPIFVPRDQFQPVETIEAAQKSATESAMPGVSLEQNIPNPVNGTTTIRFTTPQDDYVRLVVTDMQGKEVAVLIDEPQPAGTHEVALSIATLPASGKYNYTLVVGKAMVTRSMYVVK